MTERKIERSSAMAMRHIFRRLRTEKRIVDAGVVGINLEDGLVEGVSLRVVDEQCARIVAVRETAAQMGLHLVINARVDRI